MVWIKGLYSLVGVCILNPIWIHQHDHPVRAERPTDLYQPLSKSPLLGLPMGRDRDCASRERATPNTYTPNTAVQHGHGRTLPTPNPFSYV